MMGTEDQICRHYESELARIAALDRRYYLVPCPSLADRAEYAARQAELEQIRARFCPKNASLRQHVWCQSRRCRFVIRKITRSTTPTLRD
jgi:hypothetical protein